MKKSIILLILSILIIGCSGNNYSKTSQPTQAPSSPAIGGSCGVQAESSNQVIIKVPIVRAL